MLVCVNGKPALFCYDAEKCPRATIHRSIDDEKQLA